MTRRPKRLAAVAVIACFVGVASMSEAQPVGAEPQGRGPCRPYLDICVEDEVTTPGDGNDAVPVSETGAEPVCRWERAEVVPAYISVVLEEFGVAWPAPSEDAYLIRQICDGRITAIEWVTPTEQLPTPEELAEALFARLERELPAPVVASDPANGEPAIVGYPTFVTVENWTGRVNEQECDPTGALCVSVAATPALSFTPGEPGARTVACAGAGTRFADEGPTSSVQASAPGACAWAYQLRTGIASRPEAWPGAVTVTWELTWSSTSGASGTLPDIAKATAVPRAVNEVQAVIEG